MNQRRVLDETDSAILQLLQENGRMSTADLARAIAMSPSSTADRVRRLTDHGVLMGYRAVVDPVALGYPLTVYVRLRLATAPRKAFHELLDNTPQILEAHHLTGEDCFLLKLVARSMPDLEGLTDKLATFGHITTNIVVSSDVTNRPLPSV